VKLAEQPPFRLASMVVEPPLREVSWPGGRQILQPKAMQVLIALASAEGAVVSRDSLVAQCWGAAATGDDAIQRVIRDLRALGVRSGGEFTIQTISKVGHRLILTQSPPVVPPGQGQGQGQRPRLAVLAFDNLTGDTDLAWFADAMSEEILHTVVKTTDLEVVGRSTSFALRGADKAADRAAALLGVTHLLDGSVRRDASGIRITTELVDCASRLSLWSGRFERPLAEVPAMQDGVARAVARALNVACAPSSRRGAVDPLAFDLFLKAREIGDGGFSIPHIGLLEQATARSPGFAAAWALLAYSRAVVLRWTDLGVAFETWRASIVEAAGAALALDADMSLAHMALAMIEPLCGRVHAQRAILDRALAAAPSEPVVLLHGCTVLDQTGHQRRALELATRAYAIDPRFAGSYYAELLVSTGDRDAARVVFDRDLARWPNVLFLNSNAVRFALEDGDWAWFDRVMGAMPPAVIRHPVIQRTLEVSRQLRPFTPAIAQEVLTQMRAAAAAGQTVSLHWAGLLCDRGHGEAVFDILAGASFAHLFEPRGRLAYGEMGLNMLFTPLFAAMRRDVRFMDLCARLGLTDYWAATGQWPDFAAEVRGRYDVAAEATRRLAGRKSSAA
jgi:adenylate cyclase